MLFLTLYSNKNPVWCALVVGGRGVGLLVDLLFSIPFINYPFYCKGNSEADPTRKSNSSARNSGPFCDSCTLAVWGKLKAFYVSPTSGD